MKVAFRKIDWGPTMFIALFSGFFLGWYSDSVIMGILILLCNIVGGVINGLMFGQIRK